jgi:hypothetical protein
MPHIRKEIIMIEKRFGVDFFSDGGALTLGPDEVSESDVTSGYHVRKHKSNWTIEGEVREDYFVWVNDFKARHPSLGKVWGNFEGSVFASSERAFKHFMKHHPPDAWDYWDI